MKLINGASLAALTATSDSIVEHAEAISPYVVKQHISELRNRLVDEYRARFALQEEVDAWRKRCPKFIEAARTVIKGFSEGVFTRSTVGDSDPMWGLKLVPYIKALAELKEYSLEF